MAAALRIDVYLDLVCPWCLIGKRFLDKALLQFHQSAPHCTVHLHWHSVQLLPDTPQQGWDFKSFYLQRLGGAETLRLRQAQVNAAALSAGFQIDFESIPHMPNTFQAHQLLGYANTQLPAGQFVLLLERLFAAHFHERRNLGERASLLAIAADMGLQRADVVAWMDSGAGRPLRLDVPAVPFLVFNRKLALSGAQPVPELLEAMRKAHAQATPSQYAYATAGAVL